MALTLGVSIDIAEPARSLVRAARLASGDPLAPYVPPHVTLQGPTDVDETDLDRVVQHLRNVAARHDQFELCLAGTGTFRPITEVVFLRLSGGEQECRALQQDVCQGVLRRELSYDYHPHVTLAHAVALDRLDEVYTQMADFNFRQTITKLSLYQQCGAVWSIIETFDLAPATGLQDGSESVS